MLETFAIQKTMFSQSDRLHRMTDEEVAMVQREMLAMFLDMKAVMDQEKIPYVFGGGSVLGAIRHRGFIPWDDDMDINMERRYLVPFQKALEKAYGDKYYVQSPVSCPEHYSTFWDVQKRGTSYRESLAQAEGKCGLKVDIFPIENTYTNPVARKLHGILCDGSSLILSCIRFHDRKQEYLDLSDGSDEVVRLIRKKARIGAPFSLARKFWLRFANAVFSMCKNDASEYVVVPSGRKHFKGEIYLREDLCVGTEAEFEGTTVMVPKATAAYLTHLFGEDYMSLPPEEAREHHMLYELRLK